MGYLNEIRLRHGWDRWRDVVFIAGAVLLTLLSIGSVTSKAAGKTQLHRWTVTVVETPVEVAH